MPKQRNQRLKSFEEWAEGLTPQERLRLLDRLMAQQPAASSRDQTAPPSDLQNPGDDRREEQQRGSG